MKKALIFLAVVVVIGIGFVLYGHTKKEVVPASASLRVQQTSATANFSATSSPSFAHSATASSSVIDKPLSVRFEVVTTVAAQERGLSGRMSIPDNYGMLFVFPKDDTYGFWMKDMLTSIDMIWLSDNGTIIKIDASVPANSYPAVYYPSAPVKYVLETRAGFAKEHSWTLGTKVTLPLPYGK